MARLSEVEKVARELAFAARNATLSRFGMWAIKLTLQGMSRFQKFIQRYNLLILAQIPVIVYRNHGFPYQITPMAQHVTMSHSSLGQLYGQKNRNVTLSHSLLGQLYGPKRDIVIMPHSLLGQLYGPSRDQKLFKNSTYRKRDSVTFLIRST